MVVVYNILPLLIIIVGSLPYNLFFTQSLLVYGSMLLLSTTILSSYSDLRKSYSVYVGVGLGIAHGACLNARRRVCTCRL